MHLHECHYDMMMYNNHTQTCLIVMFNLPLVVITSSFQTTLTPDPEQFWSIPLYDEAIIDMLWNSLFTRFQVLVPVV